VGAGRRRKLPGSEGPPGPYGWLAVQGNMRTSKPMSIVSHFVKNSKPQPVSPEGAVENQKLPAVQQVHVPLKISHLFDSSESLGGAWTFIPFPPCPTLVNSASLPRSSRPAEWLSPSLNLGLIISSLKIISKFI